VHQHFKASPETFLKVIAPYRDDLVVAVEWIFTWSWLADLCTREGLALVLGHALDMKAIHGGKAKHDRIDAQQIAALLRGGMLPQASVYPAAMRATRDLLRRRVHLMRTRAERLTHSQNTHSQYHRPEIGKKIAYKANRDGVAERCSAPAVQKSIAVDLALLGHSDALLRDVALSLLKAAQPHNAHTRYRLRTVPGIGEILSLVLLDEMHDIQRCPRVQAFVSSCRLVKCAKESAGKRDGTAGTQIGHAYLTWAFSEAAVLCRRAKPPGQKSLGRRENKHGKSKALTVLAHKLARAVDDRLPRHPAFDMHQFLTG
jgi:transposase